MSHSPIGSSFEMALRILLILNEVYPVSLDEQQIRAIDFISVYANDFGLLDENLHGYSNYRYSEYPARKNTVSTALKELVLEEYIQLHPTSTGYRYFILEAGKTMCKNLTSSYAIEYTIAIHAVVRKFDKMNSDAMLKEINMITIQSLEEAGQENVLY